MGETVAGCCTAETLKRTISVPSGVLSMDLPLPGIPLLVDAHYLLVPSFQDTYVLTAEPLLLGFSLQK
jgi:hypothetical protein